METHIPLVRIPPGIRFAAWPKPPNAEGACGSRTHAYVPFCAEVWSATVVILARCSAPGRVCLIADSNAVGGTHSTGCRERFSMLCSRGRRPPCLLRLLRPCVRGHEEVPGYGQLRSPLVATKVPAFGHEKSSPLTEVST